MEDQRNLPNDDASVNRNPEENSDGSESDDVEEVSWEELFDKIPNSFSIRVVCVLIVICTIIQASMGAAVWNFMVPVSTRYGTGAGTGAWWAPFPSLAAAATAFAACVLEDVRILVAAGFVAFFSVVPLVVGAIWDGAAREAVMIYRSCAGAPSSDNYHTGTFQCYGNQGLCGNISLVCPQLAPYFTPRPSDEPFVDDDSVFPTAGTCYCSDGWTCAMLRLLKPTTKNYNCSNITNLYADELATSITFCTFLSVLSLLLAGMIFNSICCFGSAGFIEPPPIVLMPRPNRPDAISGTNISLNRGTGTGAGTGAGAGAGGMGGYRNSRTSGSINSNTWEGPNKLV